MTLHLSRPFESLLKDPGAVRCDVLIVGSGYGAAMAALAFAMAPGKRRSVTVLERGQEFQSGELPRTIGDLPGHVSITRKEGDRLGYAQALVDVRLGEKLVAIVGRGLGGTSLINAGVAVDPELHTFADWPEPAGPGGDWLTRLQPSLKFVRKLLGVRPHPRGEQLAKVKALGRLADALKKSPGVQADHSLADIAVTFQDGPNAVGVEQRACNDCGNCFTGCNTGAKNTLAANAWPLAKSLGVDIVTGATVRSVRAGGAPWIVEVQLTSDPARSRTLSANTVILAAGTFGSTEILMRSREAGLPLSPRLGERFSLNGDGIAFGYGQKKAVHAFAKVPSMNGVESGPGGETPGPTIVSCIRVTSEKLQGLIEDATVPLAIGGATAELLSLRAMLPVESDMRQGLMFGQKSAWHDEHPDADPLSSPRDLAEHHQVLLTIGKERRTSTIAFCNDGLVLRWDAAYNGDVPNLFHSHLGDANKNGGFDGGMRLPNPFWQAMPPSMSGVFEGADQLGGTQFSNHPLGGCPMGAAGVNGVVDPRGCVFRGDGEERHDELYVLDGAIVPEALGINPFMTIAALAHHLAQEIVGAPAWNGLGSLPQVGPTEQRLPQREGPHIEWPVEPQAFVFRERLFGPGDDTSAKNLGAVLRAPASGAKCYALDVTLQFPALDTWLDRPAAAIPALLSLRAVDAAAVIDSVPQAAIGDLLVELKGQVHLFVSDLASDAAEDERRTESAKARFRRLRRPEWLLPALARAHARWRLMRYEFATSDGSITLSGAKHLAYDFAGLKEDRDESNVWHALGHLKLTARRGEQQADAEFRVDLVHMAQQLRPLQAQGKPETPWAVQAAARLGAFFFRVGMQTHFWSFGAPTYKNFPHSNAAAAHAPGRELVQQIRYVDGDRSFDAPLSVATVAGSGWRLQVARAPRGGTRRTAMLVHGLAHSSRVFTTETVDRNLAGYLLSQGYDVWLLDHRLSTALDVGGKPDISEVASDVAEAVAYVDDASEREGVHLFTHCVGSAMTSMSVLEGRCQRSDGSSRIRSLVMHAIPPWIQPSESNLLRAYIGVFFKDRFFPETFDPIVHQESAKGPEGLLNTLLDRFGASLPWSEAELTAHADRDNDKDFGRAICNRMTALYGYEWQHANLDPRTHANLHTLVGPATANAYRQLYHLLHRRRVTDAQGRNRYLTVENLRAYWRFPTLFLHGSTNEVFNAESSRLSQRLLSEILNSVYGEEPSLSVPVSVAVVPGYGHMDLLFGLRAHEAVFPLITQFFGQATVEPPPPGVAVVPPRAPATPTQAPRTPLTGPILSRPRRDEAGRPTVRLWSEINEYQTSKASNLRHFSQPHKGAARELKVVNLWRGPGKSGASDVLQRATFVVADVACDQLLGPVFAQVEFPDGGLPVITPNMQQPISGLGWLSTPVRSSVLEKAELSGETDRPRIALESQAEQDEPWIDWRALPWFDRFMQGGDSELLSFVVSSCAYPGTWIDQECAALFHKEVRKHVEGTAQGARGIDHLMLLGDQIYADATLSLFDIAEHRERYQECYRRAFRQTAARWVLAHVPTYFAIDDHELRDNFPAGAPATDDVELAGNARQEAWNFQIHSDGDGGKEGDLDYTFESVGHRFFVFDTRARRDPHATGLARVLDESQARRFQAWVERHFKESRRPMFIATGSPLAPIPRDEFAFPDLSDSGDTLRAHPAFVEMLYDAVQSVGFRGTLIHLSGDAHLSMWAKGYLARVDGQSPVSYISVVASGLNIPLPFANTAPGEFEWGAAKKTWRPRNSRCAVQQHEAGAMSTSRSHGVRIDVEHVASEGADGGWKLRLSTIDAVAGTLVAAVEWTL